MISSLCSVITPNASLYMRKLCKHWAHKFPVRYNDTNGAVDFSETQKVSFLSHNEMLSIHILSQSDESTMDRLEKVVAEHLERFAFKESLSFSWQRDSLAI